MKSTRYRYDPERVRFEKVKVSYNKRIRISVIYLTILLSIFIIPRVINSEKITSPKALFFSKKNEELKLKYDALNRRISNAEDFLSEIQVRDDKVYRSVFDLDPIPSSVRDAGFGGSDNYFQELYSRNTGFVRNTAQKLDELTKKAKVQSVSFSDIYLKAKKHSDFLERKPSIQPISPKEKIWLTSSFGYRLDPFTKSRRMHCGIDLAGQVGIKVHATGGGVVEVACYNPYGYGNEVVINHGYGYRTVYAHLHSINLKEGDVVKRGELIGELGNTGRSTGPHLHYEIRKDNRAVNPFYFYFEDLSGAEFEKITSFNSN